jgi:hypothetical protein
MEPAAATTLGLRAAATIVAFIEEQDRIGSFKVTSLGEREAGLC